MRIEENKYEIGEVEKELEVNQIYDKTIFIVFILYTCIQNKTNTLMYLFASTYLRW